MTRGPLDARTPQGPSRPEGARLLSCSLLAVLVLAACGGGGEPAGGATVAAGASAGGLEQSWMLRVVQEPTLLEPVEQQTAVGRAWLDLYHNDLRAAVNSFSATCTPSAKAMGERAAEGYPCVGLARAHLEQAATYAGAAEIDRIARRQFFQHRAARTDEVLASVHEAFFSGINLVQSGDEAGRALLAGYSASEGADPLLVAVATAVSGGAGDPLIERIWGASATDAPKDAAALANLPESDLAKTYRARLALMIAVAQGDLDGATAGLRAAAVPGLDVLERLETQTATGETLEVILGQFDSAFLRSLSRMHALAATVAVGGAADLAILKAEADLRLGRAVVLPSSAPSVDDGIALVVFTAFPAPVDRLASLRVGARPGLLTRLGATDGGLLATPAEKLADLDSFVRLSNSLKERLVEAIRAARPEGASMDTGMGLSDRFLGRLLIEGAQELREGFDTRLDAREGADMATAGVAARSLLEMAMDKNPSPPSHALKQARISFRNDPPLLVDLARSNLDTKRPYFANDYIRPLTEVYPELSPVRDGLAALDSAWNPVRAGAVR